MHRSLTLTEPFEEELKGRGQIPLQQLHDTMLRINNFTVEDRIRGAVKYLRRANRYWPEGRHPKAP